ncbi:MAG: COX15/CtaA family protein, partial [Terrimesophilobacter sp.]
MSRWVRILAWASLATEIIIVGTGGAVRLTASGLGCPTWPQCTPGSLIPTPELGYHALVEFSNRMMSGIVAIVALVTFLFLVRLRTTRPELFWLSFTLGILVLVQAGIGGITVLSSLESYIVGLHFILSAIMVVLAATLVWFVY